MTGVGWLEEGEVESVLAAAMQGDRTADAHEVKGEPEIRVLR